ncbi:thioredoxin domain-containing protein [Virgibacillus halophilus]|uniref:thioredoxin domain-containing protein n=1 Tax=Tigheibacillus halophilus TaxID=361280 RepID=UPI00363D59C4
MPANRKPNRLIDEKSPYLLQHAYNPVDWYPWGEEAFDKAKQEGKPIFLSIGYSTCHWCHVMARESFKDNEIAAYLNRHYVSIKVDREERPDVDSIYMKVCQMMTGQGGWPLTIFMTPDQIPFYAGTYFPKYSKYHLPGLLEAITQLSEKYRQDPAHIHKVTKSVRRALKKTQQTKSKHRLTKQSVDDAFQQLRAMYDHTHGGFGGAPKFPQPQNLLFLLRYHYFSKQPEALEMVEQTLHKLAAGGIYDHIGFGFCRYATDEKWLVPHFEKMLYDNALLLMAYTECYQVTKKTFYKRIAEQIIHFTAKEMTDENGAFYTAIDADSEGVEGKFYVWDHQEIFDVLDNDLANLYTRVYQITPQGNFEGKNIPNLIQIDKRMIAESSQMTENELDQELEKARIKLQDARKKRTRPHTDDKILTGNNALMIAALAKAGNVLANQRAMDMAHETIGFIEENLYANGRLMARYRHGETKYHAYLDDYAFLSWAYLELYQATLSLEMLHRGNKVIEAMTNLFWDEENGGFYFSGNDAEKLIASDKEVYDGALPSGNSVAGYTLAKFGHLTGTSRFLDQAEEMTYTFFDDISQRAANACFFLQAVIALEFPAKEVVVIGDYSQPGYKEWIHRFTKQFLPDVSLLTAALPEHFNDTAAFASAYRQINHQPTVYVCQHFSCQQPTTDLEAAWEQIKKH